MSEAGAISRTRSPLSRNAGEGLGVRASRSAGEGLGVRASRSAGEEGGIIPPDLLPSPPSAHPRGEEGGISVAVAISRTRSPLSRSAGEGPGVRASRSAGEGPGVRASRSAGEGLGVRASRSAGAEGGMSVAAAILRLSTIPRSRTTPLPQRGRGAGGEGVRGERSSPNPSRAAPGAARSAAGTCGGWRNRTLALQRSGCSGTVHSQ